MSAIYVKPVTARAAMLCCTCCDTWQSPTFIYEGCGPHVRACEPAFLEGWRVFFSGHREYAYCPTCKPTVPMELVHGSAN